MSAERPNDHLIIIALRDSEEKVVGRVAALLAGAPSQPDTEAYVWTRKIGDDLTAIDLDRLAAIIGWDAVERLNVGLPYGQVLEP